MKFLMLCVVFVTQSVLVFDATWYQSELCKQVIVNGKKAGFYRIQTPYHFNFQGEDYYLQKEGSEYFVKSKSIGKVKLNGEIKRVLDFTIIDNHFWVVGETGLMEFNRQGMQLSQYTEYTTLRGLYYHPYLQKIYLASTVDGLVIFDYATKTFEGSIPLYPNGFAGVSLAVAVTGDPRGNIYLALASGVQGAMSGVAVYNPVTEKMSYSEYDPIKAGYVDTYPSIHYLDGNIYLNNGGWVHQINKAMLLKNTIVPKWLSLTHTAGDTFQYVQFRGDLIFEGNKVFGCSIIREKLNGQNRPIKYGKVFSIQL